MDQSVQNLPRVNIPHSAHKKQREESDLISSEGGLGNMEVNREPIESEYVIEIGPDSGIRGTGNNDSLIVLQTQH